LERKVNIPMSGSDVNRILEELKKQTSTEEGLKEVTEILLNWIMQKEREYFLENQKESEDNKANGYYKRSLTSLFGNLNLNVPRDRKGTFRPAILPQHWKRADADFQDFILNLILQSYSPSRLRTLLQSLNLPYSPEQVEDLKNELYLKARELRTRELPEEVFALFIDAYHCQIKDEDIKRVKQSSNLLLYWYRYGWKEEPVRVLCLLWFRK
jgi:transposase-like protein